MSDNFWQDTKDILYDAINNEFYTEEERDEIIADAFDSFAGYTTNAGDIPGNFTSRQYNFYSPVDLVYWVEDHGIPVEYVFIHRVLEKRSNSSAYRVYVSNSP